MATDDEQQTDEAQNARNLREFRRLSHALDVYARRMFPASHGNPTSREEGMLLAREWNRLVEGLRAQVEGGADDDGD